MKTQTVFFLIASALSTPAVAQCCGGRQKCAAPAENTQPAATGVMVSEQPKDGNMPNMPGMAQPDKAKRIGDPYPLATCPITGNRLGSMGDPIVKLYDGREVRFCCGMCPPKFEKDLAKSLATLDDTIVKDQLPLYPLDTSVVSGKKLDPKGKTVEFVYGNRLVRLADEGEKAEFLKDPKQHLSALDKAVVEAQKKDYPLAKCPVSDEELGKGDMGEPKDMVVAGRLIRLCCGSCVKDVNKDPAKFIAMVDEARQAKGGKKDTGGDKHGGGSGHHDGKK